MKRIELKEVGAKASEFIPSEKGRLSNIGIYLGIAKRGRKYLELVKAGAHIDATGVKAEYYHTRTTRAGEVIKTKFYLLSEVIVYNRINHAKYHRLLLRRTRTKLADTVELGLDPKLAMLSDADIARLLEWSRGELLSRKGRFEY